MTQSNIPAWLSRNNNVICDVCGRKRKRSECHMAYGTGTLPVVMSCRDGCADYNHPLNYPPPVIFDGRPVADARPEQQTQYITTINPSGMTWFHFNQKARIWFLFNNPNNSFNYSGIWTWLNFNAV